MEATSSFGYWIRRQRKALDLTQQALAEQVGCSLAAIKKIEQDERRPSRQIAELLADVLGVPSSQREIFLEVARGVRPVDQLLPAHELTAATAPRFEKSFLNNLPIQLTSFIGRERELAETRQLLSNTRLLTLIGPGGTGKTRLSLQIAEEVLPEFTNGVWLVELAPLTDPSLIPQTIATVFELREAPNIPLMDILINYLRAKQLLLILDDCEHLIAACAKLSAVAEAAFHQSSINLSAYGGPILKIFKQALGKAQEQLDPASFQAAWAEGQRMTIEQALALATDSILSD